MSALWNKLVQCRVCNRCEPVDAIDLILFVLVYAHVLADAVFAGLLSSGNFQRLEAGVVIPVWLQLWADGIGPWTYVKARFCDLVFGQIWPNNISQVASVRFASYGFYFSKFSVLFCVCMYVCMYVLASVGWFDHFLVCSGLFTYSCCLAGYVLSWQGERAGNAYAQPHLGTQEGTGTAISSSQ
jgi:hypothetical protein